MEAKTDIITAIATPIGRGGVGIIRISGAGAKDILTKIFVCANGKNDFPPRLLVLGAVFDPASQEELDQALAVYMPGPHSYTAEDVVELQCHGGPRLLERVLSVVLRLGARLATPGEFTLRAFLNGRIDLAQAEAVCDLICAKTPKAATMAERQLAGALSQELAQIETGLRHLLALITVGVDFPDDVDAPENKELLLLLIAEQQKISALLAGASLGLSYREGIKTTLIGAVNTGKSSLMNALLKRERAIVTAQPGTTRDLIEEVIDLNGVALCLADTAGLREDSALDEAEQIGISRSRAAAEQAQLLLLVIDVSTEPDPANAELLQQTTNKSRIIVLNKIDIASAGQLAAQRQQLPENAKVCPVSAETGAGLDELKQAIAEIVGMDLDSEAESPLINNLRHEQALRQAAAYLDAARQTLNDGFPADLAGIDLENACFALGEITGNSVSDEVLTEIFSKFCLGK